MKPAGDDELAEFATNKADACVLQNFELSVVVMASEGGRVASLRSLRSGLEFLTQSARNGPYVQPGLDTLFADGPCAGIEECLPTVGRCGPEMQGGAAPDHGDFWQLAWNVTEGSRTHLRLQATGFSVPLLFSKELILDGSTLHIRYHVENLASSSTSFLYAVHPLFAVSQGDRILLPQEAGSLDLHYSRYNRLGARGATISWPVTESGIALDVVEDASSGIAEMLYTGRLKDACCGIYRSSDRQGIKVSFDLDKLPYLGLWLCYGGWPEGGAEPLQYAVALEPTTAPCGTLDEALRRNLAMTLGSGESFAWEIRFQVTDPDISFAEFCSSVGSPEALPSS